MEYLSVRAVSVFFSGKVWLVEIKGNLCQKTAVKGKNHEDAAISNDFTFLEFLQCIHHGL